MFIIDKIFNLKIDTKNKNITNITGFKQFDNNSVLNITLLQNNLALDLSNCTVRLNFLREDERILLYMADIVSAKEGKVSIKLSPEVLKKTGNVKADISVFDSNLLKITSATFNLRVEKSIYNDTYFTDKDLDLMQQEYAREKERQKAESARSENELERITKEGQRNSNENTRNSNEEARKKAESTRVSEWNNVKKDANNIKNTLETTIDTANKSNSNLQSTIDKADTTTYATKGEVKTLTTQYEDVEKTLNNFGGRNYILNSGNFINLNNWKTYGNVKITKINTENLIYTPCINIRGIEKTGGHYVEQKLELNPNTTYTFSIYYGAGITDSDLKHNWNLTIKSLSGKDTVEETIKRLEFKNGYNREVFNFTTTDNSKYLIQFGGFNIINGNLEVYNLKLEKGLVATDWNVAPEEVIANSKRLDAIEKILIDKGYMTVTQKL